MRVLVAAFLMGSLVAILGVDAPFEARNDSSPGRFIVDQGSNSHATGTAQQEERIDLARSDVKHSGNRSTGSRMTREEAEKLIRLHNKVRLDVGVGPLRWSNELAAYAQQWADHLASVGCRMAHRPHSGKYQQRHGENLFTGTAAFYGVEDAVRAWEGEKNLYKGGALDSSNWYESGHYTQIVWRQTEYLGCANVECGGNIIVVCNYDPPGNVLGQKPY